MGKIGTATLVLVAAALAVILLAPPTASAQGAFVGPGNGGPASGTMSGNTLTYNGATYTRVNGKVTFPDCTVYIAMDSGYLIAAGVAAGCTPGGGSGGGGGSFVGPGSGGPAAGTVNGNTLTYNGATYSIVNGRVTFPDCTVYIVVSSGYLIGQGTAAGCTPSGGGGGTSPTTPTITWPTPASITAGTALSGTQLNATASSGGSSVAGTFVYNPASGTLMNTAGNQTLQVTFTPTNSTLYTTATGSVTLVVTASGGGGGSSFVGPGNGGPASGSVSGTTLTYNGATYPIVNGKVTFPDCTVYIAMGSGLLISAGTAPGCNPAPTTATVTWATPSAVVAGTVLSGTQLNATANVAGTFVYNPPAGTVMTVGNQTLSVTFTPTSNTYSTVISSVTLVVTAVSTPTTPTISWATPAAITAGTALSGTQLNATATSGGSSVAGTFVYNPASGTVMSTAGAQTLSVTFNPTNTTLYNSASSSVTLVVNASGGGGTGFLTPGRGGPASGTVTGSTLIYNGGQFAIANGKVTFPDCSTYIVTSNGALISLGTASPCTPGSTQVLPAITWATPAPMASGTALSVTQLNATTTMAGTFVYTPPAGTVPADGTTTLNLVFTPADTATYTSATASVTVAVGAITLGPSNGGPTSGTLNGSTLTYNGLPYVVNANNQVQLPDCKVYTVVGGGAILLYVRNASSCGTSGGGGGGGGTVGSLTYVRAASSCAPGGVGPSNGGPTSGTVSGSVLTYNGATFNINTANQVQLPDCNVYTVTMGSAGGGGSVPGGGPLQTWTTPKLAVTTTGGMGYGDLAGAYDAATKRYLMILRYSTRSCGGADAIWGIFLNSNGDPDPAGATPFLISVGKDCAWFYGTAFGPAVAATGDGRFMVTYTATTGNPDAPYKLVHNLVEFNGVPTVAAPVTIATTTSHETPSVTWMPHAQQFMVMWSTYFQPKKLYSMAITRDGGPAQAYRVTDNGDLIDMATASVAQGSDNNLMVVVWRDSSNQQMSGNGGISYTQVTESGSPMINTGNVVGPSSTMYRYPRIAFNPKAQKYLSIYTDYAYTGCNGGASGGNIMGRTFGLSGTPVEAQSFIVQKTDRCNGTIGDDQFTELSLRYENVNDTYVVGARGQDGGPTLPVWRMTLDSATAQPYTASINSVAVGGGSPTPLVIPDGTGKVLYAYRADAFNLYVMFGSK